MAPNQIRQVLTEADRRLPKVVDPRTHAVLDHLTTGAFCLVASMYWGKHRRASALALINAMMVFGLTIVTDYSGKPREGANIRGLLSFKAHRTGDIIQAITAAIGPTLMGFGKQSAAVPFRIQAGNEALVIGITDWEAGGKGQINVGDLKTRIRDAAA